MVTHLRASGLLALSLLSLSFAACGGSVETGAGGNTTTGTTTVTTTTTTDTTTSTSTSTSTTTTSTSTTTGTPSDCVPGGSSTLPGVHIEFPSPQCTFSYADPVATIAIAYEIVVDADISGVVPSANNNCAQPGPSGLISEEVVDGNGQHYCICDSGKCAPPGKTPVTLKKGVYPVTFEWDRHNWNGPSDFGNPKGPLFPVGDYTLTVSAKGLLTTPDSEQDFLVTGTLPIHLVP